MCLFCLIGKPWCDQRWWGAGDGDGGTGRLVLVGSRGAPAPREEEEGGPWLMGTCSVCCAAVWQLVRCRPGGVFAQAPMLLFKQTRDRDQPG